MKNKNKTNIMKKKHTKKLILMQLRIKLRIEKKNKFIKYVD